MNYYIIELLSLSIWIPGIIGAIRFPRIHHTFYPFIFYIWLGVTNETISGIIIRRGYSNAIPLNIYCLLELCILLWQFSYWNKMNRQSIGFIGLYIFSSLLFLLENTMISDINHFNSYFLIYSSCLQLFMSIHILNLLVMSERGRLVKNPVFIICSAFVLFYLSQVITECFWIYGINISITIKMKMQEIHTIINFISIILYTIAIIWMPTRYRFSTPLS